MLALGLRPFFAKIARTRKPKRARITRVIVTQDHARSRTVVVVFRGNRARYYTANARTLARFTGMLDRAGGLFHGHECYADRYESVLITL